MRIDHTTKSSSASTPGARILPLKDKSVLSQQSITYCGLGYGIISILVKDDWELPTRWGLNNTEIAVR